MKQITVEELKEMLKNFDDKDVVCVEDYNGGTSTVTSIGKASCDYEETDALVFCTDTYDKVDKLCCNTCKVLWSGLEEVSIDENKENDMSRYEGGYHYENYNRPMRHMVEDVAATREAAYRELEEMAHEMLKFIDENRIGTFTFEITSHQRGKSWTIEASEKDICGKFKWDDSPSKEGKDE